MASSTAPDKPAKRQIPARVDRDDHAAITRLAGKHERSVGGEYRAAIKAWIEHCEEPEAAA